MFARWKTRATTTNRASTRAKVSIIAPSEGMWLRRLHRGDGRTHEVGPVADQAVHAPAGELPRSLDRVHRPGEDQVGDLAELPDAPGVEQALVDRDSLDPAAAQAPAQARELPRVPDRVDEANALDARERLEQGPAPGA